MNTAMPCKSSFVGLEPVEVFLAEEEDDLSEILAADGETDGSLCHVGVTDFLATFIDYASAIGSAADNAGFEYPGQNDVAIRLLEKSFNAGIPGLEDGHGLLDLGFLYSVLLLCCRRDGTAKASEEYCKISLMSNPFKKLLYLSAERVHTSIGKNTILQNSLYR
jgi:hypothetical protein